MSDLDTTEKRRSGLQTMRPPFGVMPDQSLALDAPSRAHMAFYYSGEFSAPSGVEIELIGRPQGAGGQRQWIQLQGVA